MEYLCIGKVVGTHGIKGEIRILSSFEMKEKVFKKDFIIYIDKSYEKFIITNYRHHKEFEMITMEGLNNINDVLRLKGKSVYINRDDLNLSDSDYILEDLINLEIYENAEYLGKVNELVYNNSNILLSVLGNKNFYIPVTDYYLKKVDLKAGRIDVENTKGLII